MHVGHFQKLGMHDRWPEARHDNSDTEDPGASTELTEFVPK